MSIPKKYTTKDVTKPFHDSRVITNSYWLCIDGNPEKSLFFGEYHAPQCNMNERINKWRLEKSVDRQWMESEGIKSVFVEFAYAPKIN